MQRRVFAVKGPAGCGKSKTVRCVYKKLTSKFPRAQREHLLLRENGRDVCVVLRIGEIKIGIESDNHPKDRTKDSLDWFLERGCNVIVCATLTRGGTASPVEKLGETGWKICPIPLKLPKQSAKIRGAVSVSVWKMVARDGIEPPTPAFSGLRSTD